MRWKELLTKTFIVWGSDPSDDTLSRARIIADPDHQQIKIAAGSTITIDHATARALAALIPEAIAFNENNLPGDFDNATH